MLMIVYMNLSNLDRKTGGLPSTGDRHIAECNGKDMYWGTGIYLDDPKSLNRNVWNGKNKLGE